MRHIAAGAASACGCLVRCRKHTTSPCKTHHLAPLTLACNCSLRQGGGTGAPDCRAQVRAEQAVEGAEAARDACALLEERRRPNDLDSAHVHELCILPEARSLAWQRQATGSA
eukprot:9202873-Alexandrium_andersonii.AAC.1